MPHPDPLRQVFAGGGEMGALLVATDWSATSLGPVDRWPQSLRTTVSLCLSSRAPMMVAWGPDHVQVYNDALAPLMGPKHPAALGRPYLESFAEIRDLMGPLLRTVLDDGESVYLEDQPVSFHREVPDEEMYWTFSWSPLRDEQGRVVGALHPAVETTGRVLAERRLRLLRDLATSTGQARSVREVCERAVAVLDAHPLDTPCSAVHLLDEVPGLGVPVTARLVAASTQDDVSPFPSEVDLTDATYTGWPLARAATSGTLEHAASGGPGDPAVVLPLGGGPTTGPAALLSLLLSRRRPWDAAQRSFLQLLASQLGAALSTAALHEQQHRVALTLQRSMLPDTSQASTTLDVAARYLPGSGDAEVGGDWYDVVPLGPHRTALVVGDVMGRGVAAAAVMGQVRTAVRAYAQLDLPPEQVLRLLDRLVEQLSGSRDIGQIVTCGYAVHDAAARTLTVASAGHPPPLLCASGDWRVWDGPVGPPLGTGLGEHPARTAAFGPGDGLLLYTDGLVEQRRSDLDAGIGRLLHAVRVTEEGDLERLADEALRTLEDGEHDDVALLAVRIPDDGLPRPVVVDLTGDARAARTARRATAAAVAAWQLDDDTADSAVLLVAELVNNAVTHTGRPRRLRLRRRPDRLVLEVADGDPSPPREVTRDDAAEGGRGLTVITVLCSAWGVRHEGAGKVVWCELSLTGA